MIGLEEDYPREHLEVGLKYRLGLAFGKILTRHVEVEVLTKKVHSEYAVFYGCRDANDPKKGFGYLWAQPHWYNSCCCRIATAEKIN